MLLGQNVAMTQRNVSESFYFPNGIPGFENCHNFKLLREEGTALAQMLSVENVNIGFILIAPEIFFPDYSVKVDEEGRKVLEITATEGQVPVEVWTILTNHSDPSQVTLNLKAPILLNLSTGRGIQQIHSGDEYLTVQPLPLQGFEKKGAEG